MNRRFNLVVAFILFGISASWSQNLWGTTSSGAADNKGVLYKTNSNGAFNAVMHNFVTDFPGASPQNSLTLAGGKLYGMTQSGGANNQGIIFEYDPVGDNYINKFDFSAATGTYPSGGLVLASNNKLYGMTTYGDGGSNDHGVLFEYVPGSTSINVLFNFSTVDAANPYGTLVQASSNGKLYGMTSGGGSNGAGVIFEYDYTGPGYVKRVDFSGTAGARPGSTPYGNLVEAPNSKLYGMTNTGGGSNLGVIFEYDPAIDTYSKMLDFTGSNGSSPYGSLCSASDGKLYGMTYAGGTSALGILFQYNPGSTSVVKKIDFTGSNGAGPSFGSLFQASNNMLYGTTSSGGANSSGVLFEYDIPGNTLADRFDFSMGSTGGNPKCTLVETNGLLYGMTPTGPGPAGNGTLFSFNTSGTFQTKLSFSNSVDGSAPLAGLVMAPNGMLYGMTSVGGVNAQGVIYEFDPGGNVYTKKADFDYATTGANPVGSLVLGANNLLYGMTPVGGANGDGVLFEYDPGTTSIVPKFSFLSNTTGTNPQGSLVLASDGLLYGMTQAGGPSGHGVLFSFDPAGSAPIVKFTFPTIAGGTNPNGSLLQAANGKLYGATNQGGTSSSGVIFDYDIASNTYTKRIDFNGTNGQTPSGDLMQASNGKLYGMTQNGGTSLAGVIYEFDPYAVPPAIGGIHNFDGANNGSDPLGNLTEVAAGKLYGTTSGGGSQSSGIIFEYDPLTPSSITKRGDFGLAFGVSPQYGSLLLLPAKQIQTVTFNSIPAKTLADSGFDLAPLASASSGLTVKFTSSDPTIATISGSIVTILQAGTVIISASQWGNGTYGYAQDKKQPLVIGKSPQTITFTVPSKVYGGPAFNLTGSASSGLTVTYVSSDPSIASISGIQVTIHKAGTINITASQAGNGTYDAAPDVIRSFFIDKKNQSIFFTTIPTRTYGDVPFALSAIADSGLPVSFIDLGPDVSVISLSGTNNGTVTILKAGSTTIKATQAGDGNYYAALPAQKLLTVNQASQTINLPTNATVNYGIAPYALPATTDKGLTITYVSANPLIASISSGNIVTVNDVSLPGVNITATQLGNTNYFAAPPVTQTLIVNKGNQTITFAPIPSKGTTDPDFPLSATSSSGLTVSYVSGSPSVATIVGGNTVHIVGAGTSVITASQAGDNHYNAATSVPQTLTVITKQNQTITFGALPSKIMGDAPFNITATASSNLPVIFSSGNTGIATVSGNTITILAAGTVSITANQVGDANYFAAAPVSQNLVVGKGNQTISFNAPPSPTEGGPSFPLGGTASSGLPITYVAITTDHISISGTSGVPLIAGLATVRATQPGNTSYNAAISVDQTFCIKPAKPTITVTNATTNSPTLTSSSAVSNIWLLNGIPIAGATNQTHTVIKAGIYTVIVTIEGCLSDASAPQTMAITGDLPVMAGEVTLYPNPVKEKLFIDLSEFESSAVDLRIMDLTGRNVHQQRATGGGIVEVNVADHATGIYILTVSQGRKMMKSKFVKN